MRTGKELILASKVYAKENRQRSWIETFITLAGLIVLLAAGFFPIPLLLRLFCAVLCSLFFVRMFTIYHDYQHHAILQKSLPASLLMKAYGVFILAPQNIWKRSHDHHHNHNSKLTINGIGSYPTIDTATYNQLTRTQQRIYLINRHPLTVIFGYFTLFIYWLNIKSLVQSPRKHLDSLLALVLHVAAGFAIWHWLGAQTFWISWFMIYFVAFALGSYLFYSQHNFPGAIFSDKQSWKYDTAAIQSTSFMVMNPVMQWLTGNIGFHHVHHLNSRIPFYRLPEALAGIPELNKATTTSWSPVQIWRCFRLKLWSPEKNKMIRLDER